MPLPRPYVGPLGPPASKRKDEDDPERASGHRRPVAPISAFSFQLFTPKKSGAAKETNDVKREEMSLSTPSRHATPLREVSTSTPIAGPSKSNRPLNSLPSPYGGPTFKSITPGVKLENGTRMSDMQWGGAKVLGKRKETEIMEEGKEVGSPGKPMKTLGQLGKVELGENLHVEEVKRRVEEEGIGVSPRGKKIVKYSGKGPPPLSFVLNNALSSQQSSLILFYASLQSTLFPRLTPKKTRITPSALTKGALKPIPKGPTVLQHLRTAPLVFKVSAMVQGRTGWSVMCRCELIRGDVGQQDLGPRRSKPDDEPSTSSATDGHENADVKHIVLLVLQPVPTDCARLGLDPRILNLKPPNPGVVSYEIGVWPGWSNTTLDGHLLDHSDSPSGMYHHQVVFASRYLIADSATTVSE